MTAPPKPEEGAACNGCGVCCFHVVCPMPEAFGLPYPEDSPGPCPILEHADGRYWCGLIRSPLTWLGGRLSVSPEAASAEILSWIGGGVCDSNAPAGWVIVEA